MLLAAISTEMVAAGASAALVPPQFMVALAAREVARVAAEALGAFPISVQGFSVETAAVPVGRTMPRHQAVAAVALDLLQDLAVLGASSCT